MSKLGNAVIEKIESLLNKNTIHSNLTGHRIEHNHAIRYLSYLLSTIKDSGALEKALVRFFKIRPTESNAIHSSVTDVYNLLKKLGILPVVERSAEETLITQFLIAQFASPRANSPSDSALIYQIMANVEPAGIRALNKYAPTFDWESPEFLTGSTRLEMAVRKNDRDMVTLLLAAGVDVNKKDNLGYSALDIAIQVSDEDMVFQLIRHPDINIHNAYVPRLLQLCAEAIKAGATERIKTILSIKNLNKAAFVNQKLKDGETLLTLAVIDRKKPMIEILLQNGADVDTKNMRGNTALSLLAGRSKDSFHSQDLEIATLLLSKSQSSINAPTAGGRTALEWACRGEYKAMVAFLINCKGINLSITFVDTTNVLINAVIHHWEAIIAQLLSTEAGKKLVNSADNQKETPLQFAAVRGYTSIVETLIQHGADTCLVDQRRNTVLSTLAGRSKELQLPEHAAIVELLLKTMPSSHVNATAEKGMTALAWAVETDNYPIVLRLVQYEGIDLEGTFDGKTIGQIAIDKNWVSVANALREKGVLLSSETEEVKALKKERDELLMIVAAQAKEIAMLKNGNTSSAVNNVVSFGSAASSPNKPENSLSQRNQ